MSAAVKARHNNKTASFIRRLFPAHGSIPLNEPVIGELEKEFISTAIDSTYVSSAGPCIENFAKKLNHITGLKSVPVVNGTAAIHAALHACGVGAGDLVITQALTFVATANAICYLGAKPIFIDISADRASIDPEALERFLEDHADINAAGECIYKPSGQVIKACLPVHCFGHPADSSAISALCRRWRLRLVEDASQALGSTDAGRHVGFAGDYSTLSFNGNKIVTTGGGGAILCPTEDGQSMLAHICSTARVSSSQAAEHDQMGFNYRMPNINAALGLAQLERFDDLLKIKRELAMTYREFFDKSAYCFISEPKNTGSNYWQNVVKCENQSLRDDLLNELRADDIHASPLWKPLHQLPMYRGSISDSLARTEDLFQRAVCLPSSATVATKGFRL